MPFSTRFPSIIFLFYIITSFPPLYIHFKFCQNKQRSLPHLYFAFIHPIFFKCDLKFYPEAFRYSPAIRLSLCKKLILVRITRKCFVKLLFMAYKVPFSCKNFFQPIFFVLYIRKYVFSTSL